MNKDETIRWMQNHGFFGTVDGIKKNDWTFLKRYSESKVMAEDYKHKLLCYIRHHKLSLLDSKDC